MEDINYLQKKKFREFDLNDPFFDTLKKDYKEFEAWFRKKNDEDAFACIKDGVQGFLYLKEETGPITDIVPTLDIKKALKIGTFKINPHGTKLGERFFKKAFDYALEYDVQAIYLTIFEKHSTLIDLAIRYGFILYGKKTTKSGTEDVYVKYFDRRQDSIVHNYPLIKKTGVKKYLLGIYPMYHSFLFPDSILRTESTRILDDVSYTNSIHKIYVCRMPVQSLRPGDLIVVYRTKDERGPAEYTAVATSICVVEEVRSRLGFSSFDEFVKYCERYSILSREELKKWFSHSDSFTIQMTYNIALKNRINRHVLADEIGLDRNERWGFLPLSDVQFDSIIEKGGVNENIIID
jgi:hypothetical protein